MNTTPTTFGNLVGAKESLTFSLDTFKTRMQLAIRTRHARMFLPVLSINGEPHRVDLPDTGVFQKVFDKKTAYHSLAFAPVMVDTFNRDNTVKLVDIVSAIALCSNLLSQNFQEQQNGVTISSQNFYCAGKFSFVDDACFITVHHSTKGKFLYGTLEYCNGDIYVLSSSDKVYNNFKSDINNFTHIDSYSEDSEAFEGLADSYRVMKQALHPENEESTAEVEPELPTVEVVADSTTPLPEEPKPKVDQPLPPNYMALPNTQTMLSWVIYHLVERNMFNFTTNAATAPSADYQVNIYDIKVMVEALWRSEYNAMPFDCLVEHMCLMIGETVRRALGVNVNMQIIVPQPTQQYIPQPQCYQAPPSNHFGQRMQ